MIERLLELSQMKVGIGNAGPDVRVELFRAIVSRDRGFEQATVAAGLNQPAEQIGIVTMCVRPLQQAPIASSGRPRSLS